MFTFPISHFSAEAAGIGVDWSSYDGTNDTSETVFSSATTQKIRNIKIDDTRALIVYAGTSNYCRARIAQINQTTGAVTLGTETVILSSSTQDAYPCLISSTLAVVTLEAGSVIKAIAVELPASGTTIGTVGAAVNIKTVNPQFICNAKINSSGFISCWCEGGTDGYINYATVSGTTITVETTITYQTDAMRDQEVCYLSDGKACIVAATSNTYDLRAFLITISGGTTPVVTDEIELQSGSFTNYLSPCDIERVDDNKMVAVWASHDNTDGRACIITESSGSLTATTPITMFSSYDVEYTRTLDKAIAVCVPDSSSAVVMVYEVTPNSVDTITLDISGTTLTANSLVESISDDRAEVDISAVSQKWLLATYRDNSSPFYGTCFTLTV